MLDEINPCEQDFIPEAARKLTDPSVIRESHANRLRSATVAARRKFKQCKFTGDGSKSAVPRHRERLMPQKLFIGNLPHEVTDSVLGEFVSNAGVQAASTVVIRDKATGQSRGFGFIELAEGEDMERAIAGLNGQSLGGRRLTVNEARPQRNDFGGGGGHRSGGGFGGGRGRGGDSRGGGGRRRDW
jgi:cold-inducible RNA-binding protein